ncbi:MAG TPA: hypothetical protein VFV81_06100 [Verrucomicrobiae bacterium]|nr:hypothetical protein [Verrucomicrobiae bacterium]
MKIFRHIAALQPLFFLCLLLPVAPAVPGADTPILPLSGIKPGMTGEWHTVVSGTRIDRFPFEVVGIAQNFIGPRRPVIICRGLDATNRLTGPVAGMSGSPVYIDGKLIGAYAYGFLYPRDQDLFGVTPIEQMLEVEQYPEATNAVFTAAEKSDAMPQWLAAPATGAGLPAPSALQSLMKPLPTPLFVSGVSERTLQQFESRLKALGLQVMQAPSGSAAEVLDTNLEPGAAVSGVLMSGDFEFAGTGTVTWRDGNRLLAFGHPFMQQGPTAMPMAPAEVITVVQSWVRSFKLINVGPVVGTIYQDRLTAIAGEIGKLPPTTHVEIHVQSPDGRERLFRGDMFQNRDYSPILSAISLLESLYDTMESEYEQTIYLDTDLEIPGHAPVRLLDTATGQEGGMELAIQQLALYETLLNNPCEFPRVQSLTFHVRLVNGRNLSRLDSVAVDANAVHPGDTLNAVIGLRNYRRDATNLSVAIPVPAGVRAPELQLFVGDADAALQVDEPSWSPPQTLDQLLDRLRKTRSHQNICVKLLQEAPGLAVEGKNLPDLPPSVAAQFESPNSRQPVATLREITLWETNLPVAGTFEGQMRLPVRIK